MDEPGVALNYTAQMFSIQVKKLTSGCGGNKQSALPCRCCHSAVSAWRRWQKVRLEFLYTPTLLGGQAWTPQRHSAPIRTALPEAKQARAISISIRRRSSASSATRVTQPSALAKALSSI